MKNAFFGFASASPVSHNHMELGANLSDRCKTHADSDFEEDEAVPE